MPARASQRRVGSGLSRRVMQDATRLQRRALPSEAIRTANHRSALWHHDRMQVSRRVAVTWAVSIGDERQPLQPVGGGIVYHCRHDPSHCPHRHRSPPARAHDGGRVPDALGKCAHRPPQHRRRAGAARRHPGQQRGARPRRGLPQGRALLRSAARPDLRDGVEADRRRQAGDARSRCAPTSRTTRRSSRA